MWERSLYAITDCTRPCYHDQSRQRFLFLFCEFHDGFPLFFRRDDRKSFIKAKYEEKRFVKHFCSNTQEVFSDLEQAIDAHNLFDLLQAASEAAAHGVDITDPLPTSVSIKNGCQTQPDTERAVPCCTTSMSSLP